MNSSIIESLRPGPVFTARFEQSHDNNQLNFDGSSIEKLKQTLQSIHPLNIIIKNIFIEKNSIIGIAEKNKSGHIKAYVIIHKNGNIELAGIIPTGEWGKYKNAWWPGAFEIPLLSQINDPINNLINLLSINGEISLKMELTELRNTAFIASHGGSSEYPHPFPEEINSFQYPVIQSNYSHQHNWDKQEIADCFNTLRKSFHTSSADPFYLKPYLS